MFSLEPPFDSSLDPPVALLAQFLLLELALPQVFDRHVPHHLKIASAQHGLKVIKNLEFLLKLLEPFRFSKVSVLQDRVYEVIVLLNQFFAGHHNLKVNERFNVSLLKLEKVVDID